MQAIKCELCGSNQLIKKDGYYQCEFCGTKYTIEEARKLIVSGTVSIDGDVKTKETDFIIRGGVLEKYNGESIDVKIPNNVVVIGKEAFSGLSGIRSVEIPDGVTEIGNQAFERCTNLTSMTIPNSVTVIGDCAFEECTSLTSMTIPNSVTVIGACTFQRCTSLTSMTIPNSVTEIGFFAFEGCTNLTSITISNSVTAIGLGAFKNCTRLSNVKAPIDFPIHSGDFSGTQYQKNIDDREYRRKNNLCQHCGGTFKGIFNKVCSKCGKPKD